MYAVIDDRGKQYKVQVGDQILVDLKDTPPGELVQFDRVLAEVMRHEKGKKLVGARFKGPHQTKWGHRQRYTRMVIREIHPE